MEFNEQDRVHCASTELFSTPFDGTVLKVYENAVMLQVNPDQLEKAEMDKIESFNNRMIVRKSELKILDEAQ